MQEIFAEHHGTTYSIENFRDEQNVLKDELRGIMIGSPTDTPFIKAASIW
jgi:hypothetical protein